MSELTFAWERVSDVYAEGIDKLVKEHEQEVELGDIPFVINWELLDALERQGHYGVLIARRDGNIVGYVVVSMQKPVTNSTTTVASVESICVAGTEKNRARTWFRILKECLDMLPKDVKVFVRIKPKQGDIIGKILEKKFGLTRQELIYGNIL